MKLKSSILFTYMATLAAVAEMPADYPVTWGLEKYSISHTLKKMDKLIPFISQEEGYSPKTYSTERIKELMKKVPGKSDVYDLSGPSYLLFQPKEQYLFQGVLSMAGVSVLIPDAADIVITKELRLGHDSRLPYSELPSGFARQRHILPTSIDIHGKVKLTPEQNEQAQLELDQTHFRITNTGQFLMNASPTGGHFGWYSIKSQINLFESFISAPKIDSQGDVFNIYGHATIQADLATFNKTTLYLWDRDSYFASELIARFNSTSLVLAGKVILNGSFVFILGFDMETGPSFPTVTFDDTPDLSQVLTKLQMIILELDTYKNESINLHFKNRSFPLFICQKGFKEDLPKLEVMDFKNIKVEGNLSLSQDKTMILLTITERA